MLGAYGLEFDLEFSKNDSRTFLINNKHTFKNFQQMINLEHPAYKVEFNFGNNNGTSESTSISEFLQSDKGNNFYINFSRTWS